MPAHAQTLPFTPVRTGIVSDPTIRPTPPRTGGLALSAVTPITLRADGRPDIFGCHVGDDRDLKFPCRFLRPQADGTLTDITRQLLGSGPLPSTNHAVQTVIGDFNRDGRPDIFVAASGYDAPPFAGETNVLLLSNADGTYSDRSSTLPQTPAYLEGACSADVNGDGFLDIFVNNGFSAGGVAPYFLMGNGDGTFVQSQAGLPATIVSRNQNFVSCVFADMDGDGSPDLVLGGNTYSGTTRILLNDGMGDFTRRPPVLLPPGALAGTPGRFPTAGGIVPVDINRDGRMDLVLSHNWNPTYDAFAMQALIQQPDATFVDETATRFPPSSMHKSVPNLAPVQMVDFNGDGWEDFYTSGISGAGSYPFYWVNNKNGTWTAIVPELVDLANGGSVAVDFNGDGVPDLLRTDGNANGDIPYYSFFGTVVRSAPGEPTIGPASGGNGQIAVSFSPSRFIGASPISSYTATCHGATGASRLTASGPASPVIVTGAINFLPYTCVVKAANANGTSLPSEVSFRVIPRGSVTVAVTGHGTTLLGAAATLTATLAGANAPAGTVAFRVNGAAIAGCEARPVSAGMATCTTATLIYGAQAITAIYSGDAGNPATASPPVTHTVRAGELALSFGVTAATVAVGSTARIFVPIKNVGTAPTDIDAVSITGPFTLNQNDCTATLAEGATCTVAINVSPTVADVRLAGSVRVRHRGANDPFEVGFGVNGTTLSAPRLAGVFTPSRLLAGDTSVKLTLTFGNPNGVPLTGMFMNFSLPYSLVTAPVPNPTTTCSTGVWDTPPHAGGGPMVGGRTAAQFSGGTLPAHTTCTASIDLSYTGGVGTRVINPFDFTTAELNSTFGPVYLTITGPPPSNAKPKVIEYYNPDLDNYFITADPAEQDFVDTGAVGRWQRTGEAFATGGPNQVCRFSGNGNINPATGTFYGPNSHFYTADPAECAGLKAQYTPGAKSWKFESNDYTTTTAANGTCPAGQVVVYRAYNNGFARGMDSNHRIAGNLAAMQEVVMRGWISEGVVMCAPQ